MYQVYSETALGKERRIKTYKFSYMSLSAPDKLKQNQSHHKDRYTCIPQQPISIKKAVGIQKILSCTVGDKHERGNSQEPDRPHSL